jgi:hypothetical protein
MYTRQGIRKLTVGALWLSRGEIMAPIGSLQLVWEAMYFTLVFQTDR